MALKSAYMKEVYEKVCKRDQGEPEFLQAVQEVLESLEPVVEKRPDIKEAGIVERIVEPERFLQFRVSWVDDNGKVHSIIRRLAPIREAFGCIRRSTLRSLNF